VRRCLSAALVPVLLAVLCLGGVSDPEAAAEDRSPVVTTLTLFAGNAEGLWRTGDWGGTWQRVRGRTSGVSLDVLGGVHAVWPKGPQVWAAGDGGLFFSQDFGDTWEPLSVTEGIRSLLLSRWPEADPTVFIGTAGGLLRSRDGGQTFTPTSLTGTAIHRLEWPGPALVVACDRGLLITTDEGEHFEGPGAGLPEGPVVAMALSSYFALDPVLFVASASGGVFRSADGGRSYHPAGLDGERVFDLVWLGPFLYAAGETGFYRKDGVDEPWKRLSTSPGRPHRLMFPLAPAAGLEAFLATDRGIFRTTNAGEDWQTAGLEGQDVLEIATFPAPEPVKKKRK
jgi:hypothetical protein